MVSMFSNASTRPVVAVVEDDPELREQILVPMLVSAGFDATGMASALDLYRAMAGTRFDLIVLDVGLPDGDGFAIAHHLRGLSPSLGIVMLTGYSSDQDRLRGLEAGVDAYLSKPVEAKELVATLRNLERRIVPDRDPSEPSQGGWRLSEGGWRLLAPDGSEVTLNLSERQVVTALVSAAGAPVARDVLIAGLVENAEDFDPHRLEMLVYRLRRKSLQLTGQALPLRTIRGVGYALAG